MKRILLVTPIVLVLALALPVTAFAAPLTDGRVVLGSHYTLEAGETLDGDLAVIGGSALLEAGSTVEGDVFVMGGNVEAFGVITGDLAVMGGNVSMAATSVVEGDLVTLGGNVDRGMGRIEGNIMSEQVWDFPMDFDMEQSMNIPFTPMPVPSISPVPAMAFSFLGSVLGFIFRTILIAALAVLVVIFLPDPTERVAKAVVDEPWVSGGVGLLTAIVAPILIFFFLITICFALVGIVGGMVLVVAAVFGWIALGLEVGKRLAKALDREWQPVLAAGVGTLILAFVANGASTIIPCVGWLAPFLVSIFGLGAVFLTRFGTREYISASTQLAQVEESKPTRRTTK